MDDKPKHISVRVLPCTFLLYLISHGILSKNVATLPFVRVAGAKVRLSNITAKLFSTFFERIFANNRFIVSHCYPDFGKWRGNATFTGFGCVKVERVLSLNWNKLTQKRNRQERNIK